MCLNWNSKNRTYVTSVSERHSTIELYSIKTEQSGLEPPHRRSDYSLISNQIPYQIRFTAP